jgi:acyl-CoA thioesterase
MGNPFFDGTRVKPHSPGRYSAAIDDNWNLRPLPQGGIVTALALRAMQHELDDPTQRLRTLHTTFVSQVAHGPVHIDVELLRRGRSMSHLRAEVRNSETSRGHVTTGVFGSARRGFDFTDLPLPTDIPAPDRCRSMRDPLPPGVENRFAPMPFWEKLVEGRLALGHTFWEQYEPQRAERAFWYRFDDSPFLPDGSLDPLALVVLADTMPGAVGEKVGPNDRAWFAPSIDLTVHLLDACRSTWVLAYNCARYAGDGYASADMSLWDCGDDGRATPRLVAYATQIFLFSFLE